MNFWQASAGPDHFLISDNTNHLASGWHIDPAGGPRAGEKRINLIARDDDKVILAVIEKFTDLL